MNIVFMGTPEFACASLKSLHESTHRVSAVVTVPDKPAGRGRKLKFSAVKELALEYGLPVLQPEKLKDPEFINALAAYEPDLIVVVAFRILPEVVFSLPRLGSVNLHASLLPAYRGAAPINRALMAGEKTTGVSTFFLEKRVDTGNIISQEKVEISPDMTAGELHDVLMMRGSGLLLKTVNLIEKGGYLPVKQDDSKASPAPKIFSEDCRIDWNRDALAVHNQIRGLDPYPAAFTTWRGKRVKLFGSKSAYMGAESPGKGKVIPHGDYLEIGTGRGSVAVFEIQTEGKKRMSVVDFLKGHRLDDLEFFK
jgi:methionyl-tRNA formyltransferase